MILSRRAKEAIKTGLAMTIAYGLALGLGWEKPMWAGFAVAFVSLATIGQSLNKSAMRMFGTVFTAAISLVIIALSLQDRWLFMVLLSIYVGFCTYMTSGKKNQYFWNVCGFVCVIICMDAGPNATNAFNIAILRMQETGLGILVYSLVSILLWPTRATPGFEETVKKMVLSQHQLFQACLDLTNGKGDLATTKSLHLQNIGIQNQFMQLFAAAKSDSYDVWELRSLWNRYQELSIQLSRAMECWYDGGSELQALDLSQLFPDLGAFDAELTQRFVQIERMVAGKSTDVFPISIDLRVDHEYASKLSHFHKAALVVNLKRLQQLDNLTSKLFVVVKDIKDSNRTTVQEKISVSHRPFTVDLDRLTGVLRVMVTMWLAYLLIIYINGFPGGSGALTMAGSLGMAFGNMPQIPIRLMYLPATISILFGSVVYIFIMPQLSSFIGLGLLIFVVTFTICYLFADPKQLLARALGLSMFISIASISNEQSYSFMVAATTALMFSLVLFILNVTAYIPFNPHPERAFQRLVRRYFSSCNYLLSIMQQNPSARESCFTRWKKTYHLSEISLLPQKLATWGKFIDCKTFQDTSPQQIQKLVSSLQTLTYRLEELIEARKSPQSPFIEQEMLADIRSWRLSMQNTFQKLTVEPAAGDPDKFCANLSAMMDCLEKRIKEVFCKGSEKQIDSQMGANFYNALGAYRGVSSALVAYAVSAKEINWQQWRQQRF